MTSNDETRSIAPSSGGRTEPITNLLKSHNVGLSAATANKILMAKGILTEGTRPSETEPGKLRRFKVLTELGLQYGINKAQQLVDETTPRYFASTFEELVAKYLADE